MSQFYDQASLVLVPSGYKNGKIYSQKPLSTSGELSFSRASTATRVNSSGLVEKVRTNELLYSNDFSNVNWGKSNATLTGGQSGYDGSTNGWKIEATDVSCYISQSNYSVLRNHSIYAKAGTFNLISIIVGGYSQGVTFNLADGTIAYNSNSSLYSPVITSVGSGWYRVSVGVQASAPTYGMLIAPNDINGGTIAAGEYIYIQSAQTEYNDIATDYIATTSAAVSVGPVSGLPRLDYSVGCPSLLLEPQRTNLLTYSEQMDNAAWNKTNATITSNATTSPDGYVNADLLNVGSTGLNLYIAFSATANQTHTASIFVKAGTMTTLTFGLSDNLVDEGSATFYLSTLTTSVIGSASWTNQSASIVDYGNGWYRLIYTGTNTSGSVSFIEFIRGSVGTLYVWGAQNEIGAYATSYIPTLSSAVTRVADSASKTGISSLIGQTEGTIYTEVSIPTGADGSRTAAIQGGSDRTGITVDGTSVGFFIVTSAGVVYNNVVAYTWQATNKIALAYKDGSTTLYVNGSSVLSTTASFTFGGGMANLYLGQYEFAPTTGQNGQRQSQALLFKTRLSNDDLAIITSL